MSELDANHSSWFEASLIRAVQAKPFVKLLNHTIKFATAAEVLGELYLRLRENKRFMEQLYLTRDYESVQRLVHHVAKFQLRGPIKRAWRSDFKPPPSNYLRMRGQHSGKYWNGYPLATVSNNSDPDMSDLPKLSQVEQAVLEMEHSNIPRRQIAESLGISQKTVQRLIAKVRQRARNSRRNFDWP